MQLLLALLLIAILVTVIVFLVKKEKFDFIPINPDLASQLATITPPLKSGLWTQLTPDKLGMKIEIVNQSPQYHAANVYFLNQCDAENLRFFDSNKHMYALGMKISYAGSAVIDGKTVHTYSSLETRDYDPIYGTFMCNTVRSADYVEEKKFFDRYVFNTLVITELPGGKILVNYNRQKLKNEHTLFSNRNYIPMKAFNEFSNPKILIDDKRNFYDTDIDIKLEGIILNKETSRDGGGTSSIKG